MFKKIILFITVLTLCIGTVSYGASNPALVKKISDGLTKIKSWIIAISTPAAAVAIGSGVLMKKFSFGDEEKIVTGKKLIKSTLFSYAFILCVDLILSTISMLTK